MTFMTEHIKFNRPFYLIREEITEETNHEAGSRRSLNVQLDLDERSERYRNTHFSLDTCYLLSNNLLNSLCVVRMTAFTGNALTTVIPNPLYNDFHPLSSSIVLPICTIDLSFLLQSKGSACILDLIKSIGYTIAHDKDPATPPASMDATS